MAYLEDYYVKAKGLLKTNPLETYSLFLKCDKMEPNDIGVNNYLLYLEMIFGDYDKAVKRLDLVFSSENDIYIRNLNIYLVLLNKIYELPEKYQQYTSNLTINDIRIVNPYNLKKLEDENRVRNLIMINKCYNALKVLNDAIREKQYMSLSDNILKSLLNKVVLQENINNKLFVNAIKRRDYKQAIKVLESIKAKEGINRSREYCLKLLYVLNEGVVPAVIEPDKDYTEFVNYIDNNDFRKALAIKKRILIKDGKIALQNRPMYLLLSDVVALLDKQEGRVLKR